MKTIEVSEKVYEHLDWIRECCGTDSWSVAIEHIIGAGKWRIINGM